MGRELPGELRRLADWQQGVVTGSQAISSGLTRDTVRSKVRHGGWQRLYSGVYATFSGPVPRSAILWAATLRAGPGAMLSYGTAAELCGLADSPSGLIHLTLPASRRAIAIPGAIVHRSRRADHARHPVLAPARTRTEETVLDLAGAAASVDDACAWIARAVGRGLTTPARLQEAMGLRGRMRWRSELSEMLSDDQAGVHSALEHRYLTDVERRHELPRGVRQARVRRGPRTEYRDVLYEDYGVAVELDGRAAHPEERRWADIHRDNAAAADGVLTLRYGWFDVTQRPCWVAAQVARVLSGRGYAESRPCTPACPVGLGPAGP
jgi:hypothetical protein